MSTKINNFGKFRCPCCGYFTFEIEPNNTFELCPVCFWEDDGVQLNDPNYEGGANQVSLIQARANFKIYKSSEERFVEFTRNPDYDEL